MRRWLWAVALLAGAGRAATLTGFVHDARGRAVPAATVWYASDEPFGGSTEAPATTAADGAFALTLPDALAESGALIAHAPGRGAAVCPLRTGQSPGLPLVLALRAVGPVEGIVLDARRRPLAGAVVRPLMFSQPSGSARVAPALAERLWSATTDADGRWRLDDLPGDAQRDLLVSADGYGMERVAVGSGCQPSPASYAILKPGGSVTGRVLLPDGRPAAGVGLIAYPEWALTGADGSYVLAHQTAGEVRIRAVRPAGATWAEPPLLGATVVVGGITRAPDLRLPAGVRVSGTVVDQVSGAPLAGCGVDWRSGNLPGATATSDDSGRYEVVLAPGDYTALAHGSPPGQAVKVTVAAGTMAPIAIKAARSGYRRTRVQLRDADGPTAQQRVWLAIDGQTRLVTSDDQGQVEARLPIGQRVLYDPPRPAGQPQGPPEPPATVRVVLANPWRQGRADVPDGATLVDLPLTECPLTTVTGRVRDTGGATVAGAAVSLRMAPTLDVPMVTETGDDGAFRLPRVPADCQGTLTAELAGCRGGELVRVARLGDAPALDLTLERIAESVSGQVVDAAGRPTAGAIVFVPGYTADGPTLSAADGSFRLADLPRREVTVLALRGRRAVARATCAAPTDGLRLTLAETPPLDWTNSPTDQEREQALALVRAAVRGDGALADDGRALAMLARIDFGEALDRVTQLPAGRARDVALGRMLRMAPSDVRVDDRVLGVIKAMRIDVLRLYASWLAARLLTPEQTDLAARLLAVGTPATLLGARARLLGLVALADLAHRAGSPTAVQATDALLAALRADPAAAETISEAVEMGALSPRLRDAVLGVLPDGRPAMMLRTRAVLDTLRTDPASAWKLARGWWPGPDGGLALPKSLDQVEVSPAALSARLAVGLLTTDAPLAQRLLNPDDGQPATFRGLLTAALRSRTPDEARRWFEAASRCLPPTGSLDGGLLALAAAQAAPDLAERCRQELLTMPVFHADRVDTDAAYHLAGIDPNRVRWALEQAYAAGAKGNQVIVAMAVVDPARAVAMAQEPGAADSVRLALAAWLLADGVARRTVPPGVWCSDRSARPEELVGR